MTLLIREKIVNFVMKNTFKMTTMTAKNAVKPVKPAFKNPINAYLVKKPEFLLMTISNVIVMKIKIILKMKMVNVKFLVITPVKKINAPAQIQMNAMIVTQNFKGN